MLSPLTTSATSLPTSPSRSPAAATSSPDGPAAATNASPGGRHKTRKPGDTTRLTPLTRIIFWLMPVPA
jgi:hypothetical protein